MKTQDLRRKLERPDECIEHLGRELIKTATKKSRAYKCWEEMLLYISYLERKLELRDKRVKETIKQLKEMSDDNG